jgi:hypothetical protein
MQRSLTELKRMKQLLCCVYYKLGSTDQHTRVLGNVNSQADKAHAALVEFLWLKGENILSRMCKQMLLTYRSQWKYINIEYQAQIKHIRIIERRIPDRTLKVYAPTAQTSGRTTLYIYVMHIY